MVFIITIYSIFKCDWNILTSNCSRGGGVIIIVNNKIYTYELIPNPYDSIEQVFVLITINDVQKIILGTCHVPETSPLSVYETHANTINWLFLCFGDKTDIIIAGNYNFRGATFSWNNTHDKIYLKSKSQNKSFLSWQYYPVLSCNRWWLPLRICRYELWLFFRSQFIAV